MFHALSLLVLTGLSWVPTGAIVGFIGRRGFNLFFFQLICSIMVVLDLHVPPGGRDAGMEANMFYDERFADHFVELWRGICNIANR